MDDYGKDIIYPKYEYIKDLLDMTTKEIIMQNLYEKSDEFEKEYSIENFENKANEINIELNSYFDDMNNTLKKYASSKDEYKLNLDKEILNYQRIRRLEETDDEKLNYDQQAVDYKLDKSFQQLKKTSVSIKDFIESLNLFSNFDDKLNKYINDINYQNGLSENIISKSTDNYDDLSIKLYELNSLSLKYYDKVNKTYYKLKEFIIKRVQLINEYIENCSNITYETIANKYIDIKDDFNPTNKTLKEEKESIVVEHYSQEDNDFNYNIDTKIEKYSINNEFNLDIVFEGEEIKKPKVISKIVNVNKPNTFEIDFYSKIGQNCGKIGRIINIEFENISLITDINFNAGLNEAKINSNFSYDDYFVKTEFYEVKEITQVLVIGGITFNLPSQCIKETGEETEETISSKMNNKEKTLSSGIQK